MKLLTINNAGAVGLNTDLQPWDLPAEAITDGLNFRPNHSGHSSMPGYADWTTFPGGVNTGLIFFVHNASNNFYIVCGRDSVRVYDGSSWTDISSAAYGLGANQELDWNACQLGKIPIINNVAHYPECWNPVSTSQPLTALPWVSGVSDWASVNQRCKVMRAHNNWLFALNLVDVGTELPDGYRWSHPADINGLPPSWDDTDAAYLASKEQIGGDTGAIIDGHSLRNEFCIYSENGVNLLTLTGGDFVWSRRSLSALFGLVGANAVTEVGGTHLFIADGDIVANDGSQLRSIAHDKIRKKLVAGASTDAYDRSFCVKNEIDKEVWFCVPEDSALLPNRAYIYNYRDDKWGIKDLGGETSSMAYGPLSQGGTTWADLTVPWSELTQTWAQFSDSSNRKTVIGVQGANIRNMDPPSATSGDHNTLIERTSFPLEGHGQVNTITRLYPHIGGSSPVEVQVGSQYGANTSIDWKPPVQFIPNVDRKVDVRTTGTLHSWRIKSVGQGSFTYSGVDIEYSNAGAR